MAGKVDDVAGGDGEARSEVAGPDGVGGVSGQGVSGHSYSISTTI